MRNPLVFFPYLLIGVAGFIGLAGPTSAQSGDVMPLKVDICDPFIDAFYEEDDGDEDEEEDFIRRYDLERSETLTDQTEVMAALYEEAWNLDTGAPVERNELCQAVPSYVVHWTQLMSRNKDNEPVVATEGLFSFHKDGTFRYVFAKRPYDGRWAFENGKMHLTAEWLNGGAPLVTSVEKVTTPVTLESAEGESDGGYDEVAYRTGWFRHLRVPTTLKSVLVFTG